MEGVRARRRLSVARRSPRCPSHTGRGLPRGHVSRRTDSSPLSATLLLLRTPPPTGPGILDLGHIKCGHPSALPPNTYTEKGHDSPGCKPKVGPARDGAPTDDAHCPNKARRPCRPVVSTLPPRDRRSAPLCDKKGHDPCPPNLPPFSPSVPAWARHRMMSSFGRLVC